MAKTDIDTDRVIARLYQTVASRRGNNAEKSYTAALFEKGTDRIAQKFGEEAMETVIAAVGRDRESIVGESADLLYHLLVLWADAGVLPEDVLAELKLREGVSGITEKAAREA